MQHNERRMNMKKEILLEAIKIKNEDYEELIGQIESVKENLKADLYNLD